MPVQSDPQTCAEYMASSLGALQAACRSLESSGYRSTDQVQYTVDHLKKLSTRMDRMDGLLSSFVSHTPPRDQGKRTAAASISAGYGSLREAGPNMQVAEELLQWGYTTSKCSV
jgi:hypothetical protein